MNRNDIVTLIISAINDLTKEEGVAHAEYVTESTVIFGYGGIFDSLKLVALIVDVEQSLEDQGIFITLSDERAVSQKHSPFRTVQSMVNYICQLIVEQQHVKA